MKFNYWFIKIYAVILGILLIPTFLSSITFGMFSMEFFMKLRIDGNSMIQGFIQGHLNERFIAWQFAMIAACCALTLAFVLIQLKDLKSNCELEDQKQAYEKADQELHNFYKKQVELTEIERAGYQEKRNLYSKLIEQQFGKDKLQ